MKIFIYAQADIVAESKLEDIRIKPFLTMEEARKELDKDESDFLEMYQDHLGFNDEEMKHWLESQVEFSDADRKGLYVRHYLDSDGYEFYFKIQEVEI